MSAFLEMIASVEVRLSHFGTPLFEGKNVPVTFETGEIVLFAGKHWKVVGSNPYKEITTITPLDGGKSNQVWTGALELPHGAFAA